VISSNSGVTSLNWLEKHGYSVTPHAGCALRAWRCVLAAKRCGRAFARMTNRGGDVRASDNTKEDQRARAARNQSLFREVNERIEELSQSPPFQGATYVEFLCECTLDGCTEQIALTLEEYESVRRDSNRFFVLEGHEVAAVEDVVESNDRYTVVAKLGKGMEVAEKLDPRRSRN
jgi:hypothetical protein